MANQANEDDKVKDIDRQAECEQTDAAPSEAQPDTVEKQADKHEDQGAEAENLAEDEHKVEEQAAQIDKLMKENQELKNRLLRAQADFDNFRKRTNKEKTDARKFRAQDIVTDMLETLDNFERAMAVETMSEDGAALKKGMEMVLNKLKLALEKEGVQPIEALGKPFDPNVHQAVMQEASEAHESGIVIAVLQQGYTLNGRILRPAMVKVSA
ncbi:MAG: nucleotide exchange factor GrpE [Sporolactobacillus sp.]